MSIVVRILISLVILAVFVLGSSWLVGAGIVGSTVGMVLWLVGIIAAVFAFVKLGGKKNGPRPNDD